MNTVARATRRGERKLRNDADRNPWLLTIAAGLRWDSALLKTLLLLLLLTSFRLYVRWCKVRRRSTDYGNV